MRPPLRITFSKRSSGYSAAPPAAAGPTVCDVPACTPGIVPGVVLGAPCDNTTYYVFGVTDWGRLVFCGSPRRYDPRWFRSPVMRGIKDINPGDQPTVSLTWT